MPQVSQKRAAKKTQPRLNLVPWLTIGKIILAEWEITEAYTRDWQKVLDESNALAVGAIPNYSADYDRAEKLMRGILPGYTNQHKYARALAHFNQQVGNGGLVQYFQNGYAEELPLVLDAMAAILENHHSGVIANIFDVLKQVINDAFCPDYTPFDEDTKAAFLRYDYYRALKANKPECYHKEDNGDVYVDPWVEPVFFIPDTDIQFDDLYYSSSLAIAKEINRYFAGR